MVENQNKILSEIRILAIIREEKTLKIFTTVAFRARTPEAIEGLNQVMQKTAAGLAELHKSNVGFGKTLEWKDEMSELRERVERLSIVYPDLGSPQNSSWIASNSLPAPIRQTRWSHPTVLSVLHRRYYTKTKLALSILTRSASLSLPIFMLVLHGWIKVKVGELSDIIYLYLLERFLQAKKFVG